MEVSINQVKFRNLFFRILVSKIWKINSRNKIEIYRNNIKFSPEKLEISKHEIKFFKIETNVSKSL
jgi:hypothetical protein